MDLRSIRSFKNETLNEQQVEILKTLAKKARRDTLRMITTACSGHPGGALSSIDIYILLWLAADCGPEMKGNDVRDRIVISHGHTSAGVYAVLGNLGYFDVEDAVNTFRRDGSIFEGHPGVKVPGVEWCSGSLGQGLSVGCGFALAAKMKKQDYHVFVVMGDGEQGKGQLQEAREFAVKYGLGNLTAIVDYNGLQASGSILDVMPQDISAKYAACGWRVMTIDGHDFNDIYRAIRNCYMEKDIPTLILADTVMGKGVPAIENNYEYHGKLLSRDEYEKAMKELNQCESLQKNVFFSVPGGDEKHISTGFKHLELQVDPGTPIVYSSGNMVDCRTAFGEALSEIACNNMEKGVLVAAIDCDLLESVKLRKFGSKFPDHLIECGIQEHNAASVAGALSKSGILTFFADFGIFGLDETYGQHRMNDLNHTSVKLICTHCGLDTGEDGKTHQCIDYIGTASNLLEFKIILPADANQTDRVVRYAATSPGNILIAMGRSKMPVLVGEDDNVLFGADYKFEYGKADWLRRGGDGTIITFGNMAGRAVSVHGRLMEMGTDIGVLNISSPLALDLEAIEKAAKTGFIVTYEDHNVRTGLGSIIGTYLAENGLECIFERVGITQYGVSANPEYQYKLQKMDEDSLVELVLNKLKKN